LTPEERSEKRWAGSIAMLTSFDSRLKERFRFKELAGVERERQILAYYDREKARIPLGASEFALAPWHFDVTDHRCPHDAWIQELRVFDSARETEHVRGTDIELILLGPFHDMTLKIKYSAVRSYVFEAAPQVALRGHGDWRYDEIHPTPNGVEHHIAFERALLSITAEDLHYSWQPRT
jgi:hypothetical protein